MNVDDEHEGTAQVVLERFVERRLPVLMEIKGRVDAGELLSEGDVEIMGRLIEQAENFAHLAWEFPEHKDLIAKVIDLYEEITERGLANERAAVGEGDR